MTISTGEGAPSSIGPSSGEGDHDLQFAVARTLDEVLAAWGLLYNAYIRAGFIAPNPYGIHTVPQAVGEHVLVIIGLKDGVLASTISAIMDSPAGLPLDTVYAEELMKMRSEGRRPIEVGLFGDRRDLKAERSFSAIFELMRFTYHFARYMGATDVLCGIPPRRARLYARAFGFEQGGSLKAYATVKDNPVVLMRADIAQATAKASEHRAVEYFVKEPVPVDVFEGRFRFAPEIVAGSVLDAYLRAKRPAKAA